MAQVSAADAARYLDKESIGLRVVAELSDLALGYYSNLPPAQKKPDRSLVSIADRNVELRARELLAQFDAAAAHETGFIGEEFGALNTLAEISSSGTSAAPAGSATTPKGTWILDPIDGTTCFLSRIPTWSVLLAYVENGLPRVGIVCFPALGEVFCAASGNGARYGAIDSEQRAGHRPAQPCFVRSTTALKDAFVSYSSPSQFAFRGLQDLWIKLGSECSDFRTVSDAFGYSRVLCGGIDAMIDAIAAPYDLAAVQVLFRETPGACFGAFYGEDAAAAFCSGGAVGACSREIFLEYRRLLAESLLGNTDAQTKSKGVLPTQWMGSEWLRGAFHRQLLRAYLTMKNTFPADLRITVSAAEWCWLRVAGGSRHQDDAWCLDVVADAGDRNAPAQAFRFGNSAERSLHPSKQAEDAEAMLHDLCMQVCGSRSKEGDASLHGREVPVVTKTDSMESPVFKRQVDLDDNSWSLLKQELAASAWDKPGFLLVRHSVRMLDARGMDTYVVKMNIVSESLLPVPPAKGEGPEAILSYQRNFRDHVLQSVAPLQVPPDATVSSWLKVIQAQDERLRD